MTTLYRMFDKADRLLYVGISKHALSRIGQHARDKSWFSDIRRLTFEHYPTREAAAAAEQYAIQNETPVYNVAHAGKKATRAMRHGLRAEVKVDPQLAGDWCDECAKRRDIADPTRFPTWWRVEGDSARCRYRCEVCGHRWDCWWGLWYVTAEEVAL